LKDFFIHEKVPGLNSISNEFDIILDIFDEIILHANDTVLMAESASYLQTLLDIFFLYWGT
jgi:hypothetical protein